MLLAIYTIPTLLNTDVYLQHLRNIWETQEATEIDSNPTVS